MLDTHSHAAKRVQREKDDKYELRCYYLGMFIDRRGELFPHIDDEDGQMALLMRWSGPICDHLSFVSGQHSTKGHISDSKT